MSLFSLKYIKIRWFGAQLSDVYSMNGIVSSGKTFKMDKTRVSLGRDKIAVKNKLVIAEEDRTMNLSRLGLKNHRISLLVCVCADDTKRAYAEVSCSVCEPRLSTSVLT